MRIMGTSFFLGIMATIILGITLLSIAIIDIFEYYRKNLEKIGWEFTGEADNIDHSNNRKIGESFNFRKGKYRLGIYFSTRDLHNYEKSNGQDPLRYSVTIYPKT